MMGPYFVIEIEALTFILFFLSVFELWFIKKPVDAKSLGYTTNVDDVSGPETI